MKSGKNLVVKLLVLHVLSLGGCATPPLPGEVQPRSDRYDLVPDKTAEGIKLNPRKLPEVAPRFELEKGSDVRAVAWWEDKEGQKSLERESSWQWISAFAVSPDGSRAAIAGRHSSLNWALCVYKVRCESFREQRVLALEHDRSSQWYWRGTVDSLAFSTDGLTLTWSGQMDAGATALFRVRLGVSSEEDQLPILGLDVQKDESPGEWWRAVTPEIGGRVSCLCAKPASGTGAAPMSWQPWSDFPRYGTPEELIFECQDDQDVCLGYAQSPRGDAWIAVGSRSGARLRSATASADGSHQWQDLGVPGVVAPPVWLRSRPLPGDHDVVALVAYDGAKLGHDVHVLCLGPGAPGADRIRGRQQMHCSDDVCPAFYRDDNGRLGDKGAVWLVFASNAVDSAGSLPTWSLLCKRVDPMAAGDSTASVGDSTPR